MKTISSLSGVPVPNAMESLEKSFLVIDVYASKVKISTIGSVRRSHCFVIDLQRVE